MHGMATYFYRDGKIQYKLSFVNGKQDGECLQYDSISGKLLKRTVYKNGVLVGDEKK